MCKVVNERLSSVAPTSRRGLFDGRDAERASAASNSARDPAKTWLGATVLATMALLTSVVGIPSSARASTLMPTGISFSNPDKTTVAIEHTFDMSVYAGLIFQPDFSRGYAYWPGLAGIDDPAYASIAHPGGAFTLRSGNDYSVSFPATAQGAPYVPIADGEPVQVTVRGSNRDVDSFIGVLSSSFTGLDIDMMYPSEIGCTLFEQTMFGLANLGSCPSLTLYFPAPSSLNPGLAGIPIPEEFRVLGQAASPAVVPLPASIFFLGGGLAALGALDAANRRRSRTAARTA